MSFAMRRETDVGLVTLVRWGIAWGGCERLWTETVGSGWYRLCICGFDP